VGKAKYQLAGKVKCQIARNCNLNAKGKIKYEIA
jgi:hypothetical protein